MSIPNTSAEAPKTSFIQSGGYIIAAIKKPAVAPAHITNRIHFRKLFIIEIIHQKRRHVMLNATIETLYMSFFSIYNPQFTEDFYLLKFKMFFARRNIGK